ncbi:hypothetical protein F5Y04DRAFT_278997 [Hypomontagnella monticulosa]|nr:hypothetical protein F5Y04DRAFT_278997 [Hypomontagnella monticulosa]
MISLIISISIWSIGIFFQILAVVAVYHILACLILALWSTIRGAPTQQTRRASQGIDKPTPTQEWSNATNIGHMALLLSRIKLHPDKDGKVRLSVDEWMRPVTSITQIQESERSLGDIELPGDYKTFLLFIDGSVSFSYINRHTLRFRHSKALGMVAWEEYTEQFVESLIGLDAMLMIGNEPGLAGYISQPLKLLSLDHAGRIYLIAPEECRRMAGLCHSLLSGEIASDNLKHEITKHSVEHFGNASFLKAIKSWKNWIVWEMPCGRARPSPQIYPSFKDFLAELATRGEPGRERSWESVPIYIKRDRIALAERRLWEPILTTDG